jgi:hypothetical protein
VKQNSCAGGSYSTGQEISSPFMELKDYFQYLQKPTSGPYPDSNFVMLYILMCSSLLTLLTNMWQNFQSGIFFSGLSTSP